MRALVAAIALAAAGIACKKAPADDAAPDAGDTIVRPAGPVFIRHAPTGLEIVAPATWQPASTTDVERIARERIERLGRPPDEAPRDGTLADLRRAAQPGQPTLAAPRLVVVMRAVERPVDLDRALDRESDALRALQGAGAITVQRTARSRRPVGGVDMGELRVDYAVADPRGGPSAVVAHRAWIGGRSGASGSSWELTIVVTYVAADEDVVAREVEDVLKSTHFAALEGEAEQQ